jgi:hypothetical protein
MNSSCHAALACDFLHMGVEDRDSSSAVPVVARVRWGVGSWVTMGLRPNLLIPGADLTAHLGAQLRERYAVYVQAQAATGLFALDGFLGFNVTSDTSSGTYRAGSLGEPFLSAGLSFGYQLS